ncbi:MAG: aldo/keto reductase [Candidatus Omnitrophota bacterium]|nr:aldo/keto reductase [Candidatus Omnitrophota bacterium]
MQKRKLGKTGLQVSIIGLGSSGMMKEAMNSINTERLINYALDKGINFIETARAYGNSEEKIGQAIQKRRSSCYLISKTLSRTKEAALKDIEISLNRLKTEKIEIYQLHYITNNSELERVLAPDGALQALKEAKNKGQIDFVGFTTHLRGIAIKAMQTNEFDTIQIPYNPMEVEFFKEVISLANKMDIGVIAMMALAGGSIKDVDKALRFVLAKNISTVTIGMGSIKHIKFNINVSNSIRKLLPTDESSFFGRVRKFDKEFCRECGDCESVCPVDIPIAYISMMNRYALSYKRPYGDAAKNWYRGLKVKAEVCTECRACEKVCPYGLRIPEMLNLAHQRLMTKDKRFYRKLIRASSNLIKFFFSSFKLSLPFRLFNSFRILGRTKSLREAHISIFPEIDTRLSFIKSLPRTLQIECTTRCNLSCIMCNHTYWQGKQKDLSFENFKKIIDQFPKLYKVWMLGFGECLLNKDSLKMLRYLKSKNIKVYFIDNFTLLTKEIARELIELGVEQIWFSIERTTKEAYEKVRIGASFDEVMQNVRNLMELKREFKQKKPELNLYCTVSDESFSEMPHLIDFASNIGAKEVVFCQEGSLSNRKVQFDKQRFLNKLGEISPKAKYQHIKLKTIIHPVIISDCLRPWTPFVSVDGAVMSACYYFRQIELVEFGNIFEKSFKEIWDSKDYRDYRRDARRGKAGYVCKDSGCRETSSFWKTGVNKFKKVLKM